MTTYYVPSPLVVETARQVPDAFWRSASFFNLFRSVIATALLFTVLFAHNMLFPEVKNRFTLVWLISLYLGLCLIHTMCMRRRWPSFHVLLTLQVGSDIALIIVLMELSGGFRTSIGIMLLPYLAAAGLVSRGKTTLFHAALASLALLIQQSFQMLQGENDSKDLFSAAMLSITCFATAWLAHRLSLFATESQKLAERRGIDLANMAQINRLVIQDVSDGVLVLDEAGVIRQFNQQAERLLGHGMVAGKTVLAEFCIPLGATISAWQAGQTAPGQIDLEGGHRTVRPRFVPIRTVYADGGVVVFLEDMERLRREAQQLKLAALGRLTANIAHEIRNPLGAIGHAAQLLAEDTTEPTAARMVKIIIDNTHRLDHMVREVLDLNRRDRAQPTELHLQPWLEAFIREFREVEAIQVSIALECPAGVTIRFDEGHLHQVLWNLCRNGWRYCRKADGSLRLVVSRRDEVWSLEVRDDGPGVPDHMVAQLFEPFFTTEAKGTGLGLYVAREICAGNGGLLEYIPSSSDCRFRITFAEPAGSA